MFRVANSNTISTPNSIWYDSRICGSILGSSFYSFRAVFLPYNRREVIKMLAIIYTSVIALFWAKTYEFVMKDINRMMKPEKEVIFMQKGCYFE